MDIDYSGIKRVVLKLDDVRGESLEYIDAFKRTYALIKEKKVRAGFGIITAHISQADTISQNFKDFMQHMLNDQDIEIWQHGHLHQRVDADGFPNPISPNGEYRGTSKEYQLHNILLAQKIILDMFNFVPITFGTPFNHSDENTLLALDEIKELKTLFFIKNLKKSGDTKIYLNNRVDMESKAGIINFEFFKENLQQAQNKDLIIVQGHPFKWNWTDNTHNYSLEFSKVLDYLIYQDYKFILACEVENT